MAKKKKNRNNPAKKRDKGTPMEVELSMQNNNTKNIFHNQSKKNKKNFRL